MERAQALLERGWLDQLSTAAGRADALCRYTVLFGDPQLAFTATNRILDVTAEEVRAVAAARLRPDNRALLVYDQVTSEDTAGTGAGEAGTASPADENGEPEGAGR
jgi:predicted Zn-dependent peptidase